MPARHRASVGALWRLDAALGAVLAAGREPMITRIKLAWWRESLEKLDHAPAPAEPVLTALAADVLPRGVSGAEFAGLEQGWAVLTSEEPLGPDELHSYAAERGGRLFALSARLLGAELGEAERRAGEAWALVDLARHSGEPDATAALEAASGRRPPARWPSALRPLGMLAAVAQRDLSNGPGTWEPQGSPARMLRMMRHRITGR